MAKRGSWFGAVFGRALGFLALWGAGALLLSALGPPLRGQPAWRLAALVATVHLLLREWKLLNRWLVAAQAALRIHAVHAPGRPELSLYRWHTAGVLLVLWILVGLAGADSAEEAPARAYISAFIWAPLCVQWLVLAVGGLTRLRTLRALWRIPPSGRPDPVPTLPWLVCLAALPMLGFVRWGLPAAETVGAVAQAGLVGWTAGAGLASDQERLELLLELGPDDHIDEVVPLLSLANAQAEPLGVGLGDADLAQTWVLSVPAGAAPTLVVLLAMDRENVDTIEVNAAIQAEAPVDVGECVGSGGPTWLSDPLAASQAELVSLGAQGTLAALGLGGRPGHRAVVALVDTGVEGSHDELEGVLHQARAQDDLQGHGTQMASLIAAPADDRRGMASLNYQGRWLTVRSYPALAGPRPGADDVARAIAQATDAGVDVINLSLGAPGAAPTAVAQAVDHALRHGVVVVAAAGNDGKAALGQWPANVPGVLVVSAIDEGGERAGFSNQTWGLPRAVSAPGVAVCVADKLGGYQRSQGTSHAAALVSGLAGVMKAVCPTLSPDQVATLLADTGAAGPSGLGPRVQADQAVAALVERCPTR